MIGLQKSGDAAIVSLNSTVGIGVVFNRLLCPCLIKGVACRGCALLRFKEAIGGVCSVDRATCCLRFGAIWIMACRFASTERAS